MRVGSERLELFACSARLDESQKAGVSITVCFVFLSELQVGRVRRLVRLSSHSLETTLDGGLGSLACACFPNGKFEKDASRCPFVLVFVACVSLICFILLR